MAAIYFNTHTQSQTTCCDTILEESLAVWKLLQEPVAMPDDLAPSMGGGCYSPWKGAERTRLPRATAAYASSAQGPCKIPWKRNPCSSAQTEYWYNHFLLIVSQGNKRKEKSQNLKRKRNAFLTHHISLFLFSCERVEKLAECRRKACTKKKRRVQGGWNTMDERGPSSL